MGGVERFAIKLSTLCQEAFGPQFVLKNFLLWYEGLTEREKKKVVCCGMDPHAIMYLQNQLGARLLYEQSERNQQPFYSGCQVDGFFCNTQQLEKLLW
jgi:hypothetical protein